MKILYCGSAKSVLVKQWCDEFVKRRHQVYLLTFHDIIHKFEGTKVLKLNTYKGFGKLGMLCRWYKIFRVINSIKPDVIHSHSLQTYGIIPAMYNQVKKKQIFSIVDCMGSDIGETTQAKPQLKKKNKFILKNIGLITVKDKYALERIIELGGDFTKTIIRPSFAEPNPYLDKVDKVKNSFIFLRRFEYKYSSNNLFEVVERVMKTIPDAKFIFAKREGWEKLLLKIAEFDLTRNFEFIETDHDTILKALAKSETYFDTFYSKDLVYGHGHGTTTIEAMFSYCKLVFPDRDEYKNFRCELYEPGDMGDLADKLIIANNYSTLIKLNGLEFNYYNTKSIMDKFEKIYNAQSGFLRNYG